MNKGFTLAEILITLGIIGIISAITLPSLIQHHRNKVVETRLKKFYTTFNQAILRAEAIHGDKKLWYVDAGGFDENIDGKPTIDNSKIDQWFSYYLENFIVIEKKLNENGTVIYLLPDGSAFQMGATDNLRDILFYPSDYKKCQGEKKETSGICEFNFEFYPIQNNEYWKYLYNKGLEPTKYEWDGTIDKLINDPTRGCNKNSGGHQYCTVLIQLNNWTIPKNYPFKVR